MRVLCETQQIRNSTRDTLKKSIIVYLLVANLAVLVLTRGGRLVISYVFWLPEEKP